MEKISVIAGNDVPGGQEFLPAPAGAELAFLDGLITQAAELGSGAMDGPLIRGVVSFGPYFLRRLEEQARDRRRLRKPFQRAWELFGAWMGGLLYTDDERELEWRARAGLELWRSGGRGAQSFERLAALCLLSLPRSHPLRDEELARSMIEAALERARKAHDHLEMLRCGRSLLWSLHPPWEESSRLIDEGLSSLAALGGKQARGAAQVEAEWRFAAAFAVSNQGERLYASSDRASARPLFERSLQLYEPVVTRQHRDPQVAIQTLWHWGHLLMDAHYLEQAAETFAAVRNLDAEGSELWWHATYEEGLTRADINDWPRARRLLSSIEESLLTNYAAWVCFAPEASQLATARLGKDGDADAQRELSEGLGALALAEAVDGDWAESFRHLETTKALDYRQRAILRSPHTVAGVTAATTAGHSAWKHGVPLVRMDDERAQLTTVLAGRLTGPTIGQVAQSLTPDQAVLSLGIGQRTWGMCVLAGDAEQPSGTFMHADMSHARWLELLGELQVGELFLSGEDISSFDVGLSDLLARADEYLAAPIAALLRERGIRHLTVIPHGWLNVLPLAALPSFSEVAVSFAASAHLVADAPHSADLNHQALIVVDPTGDLPAAHAEHAALNRPGLADRLTLASLTGAEATASAVSAALHGVGLLHVAGHATGKATDPDDAGLVLAAGTTAARGRIWRAGELGADAGALNSCALVVLSACESGRAGVRIDTISDYSGLPAALLTLGASAVVATLWRIPDDLGALFADLFYERLAAAPTADLPRLVHDVALDLCAMTGSEAAARLTGLRTRVDDPIARLRLEAYARQLHRRGSEQPFAGPASWASFYHTGVRYLRLPDPRRVS